MLTIDGSFGEGGGQIIRSSLALSLITGRSFRVYNVRANRQPPGLKPQHLMAVRAAARIDGAQVDGAVVGAREFTFVPGTVTPGEYTFDVGTAGSTTLVLQTILPPLMMASDPSVLTLEGGTHNEFAPPFDFLEKSFLPLVNRLGARVSLEFERYGFYPRGGGRFSVLIEPAEGFGRLDLSERGEVRARRARALIVKLDPHIAQRELAVIRESMGWGDDELQIEASSNSYSPGNVLMIEIESAHLMELFSRVGKRGLRAEALAEQAATEAQRYLALDVPVGEHLADQLLIPLALAEGGSFVTGPLSLHTTTNIEIIRKFLDVEISVSELRDEVWKIEIEK